MILNNLEHITVSNITIIGTGAAGSTLALELEKT
jgi:aspartate oxidase